MVLTLGGALGLHRLQMAQRPPSAQAMLVLGGSIQREMFLAAEVARGMDLPVIISRGSLEPCIYRLFQREGAAMDHIWLERCALSTFDNFRYSVPLLKQWGVRRVRVVTSGSHRPRAGLLARVMLGSHGIAADMVTVQETGVPGNEESRVKTVLDVLRGLGWAAFSQIRVQSCQEVIPLAEVDMAQWEQQTYRCEHQGGLN